MLYENMYLVYDHYVNVVFIVFVVNCICAERNARIKNNQIRKHINHGISNDIITIVG